MKKGELIGIHRLLSLILKRSKTNSDFDVEEAFGTEDYEELGVEPTAIHKTNDKHEEAILELAQLLGQGIEEHGDRVEILETENDSVSMKEMKQTRDRAKELANSSTGLSSQEDKRSEKQEEEEEDTGSDGPDWSKMR